MSEESISEKLPREVIQLLDPFQAWHYHLVPYHKESDVIYFYTANDDPFLLRELSVLLGIQPKLKTVSAEIIRRLLSQYYPQHKSGSGTKTFQGKTDDFLVALIGEAKALHSSDIHIESYENRCRVRLRIDGKMAEKYILEKDKYPSLINKIKIMSNLDISEKRLPQDGRIFYNGTEGKFDIRVSVLPTLHGEKIVLRLLSNDAAHIDIHKLGFDEYDLHNYLEGIKKPNGILLISGPTGSGKTTTLYATLKLLNKETDNILTIEDPIEYTLEGINQVQLKESIGLTFGSALRTFLRQDPDIIMVGEIRDVDTANMAIRAALTGHLVLSTIHTNSAWGTVSRLIDMGVPPFLIAGTLNTSVAQRLVRLLCPNCKIQQPPPTLDLYPKSFKPFKELTEHFIPSGCEQCQYTGYSGRKAIYEVIPMDHELADKIKANDMNVSTLLMNRQIKSLAKNAFGLLAKGETSLEEIYPLLMNQ